MRVSQIVRGSALVLCVALAGALMAGCGAAAAPRASTAPPPSSPAEARAELDRLERKIGQARSSLGLPVRTEKAAADGAPAAGEPDLAFEPAAPPSPAPAAKPRVTESDPDQEESRQELNACSDNCRLSRAICHAARRICSIASYLGDADAASRCKRARRDCKDARQAKPEDCSGCR